MLAIAVTRPGEVRVVEVPKPAPGPYQAKVRTELSCLCNSTDTKLIEGHFGRRHRRTTRCCSGTRPWAWWRAWARRAQLQAGRPGGGRAMTCWSPTDGTSYASGFGGFSEYVLAKNQRTTR